MRILILGAGGIGGYYGGRLAAAGVDVTFLVRAQRAAQLKAEGLIVRSPLGDLELTVPAITQATASFDAIILSCKAFDLDSAMDAIAPAVAAHTLVLPLLNGISHLDRLDHRFGPQSVLGGLCHIGVTLTAQSEVQHLNKAQGFILGPRTRAQTGHCAALHSLLSRGGFDPQLSSDVMLEMWEKFVMIAVYAGMTCLMRAPIGTIVASNDGEELIGEMLAECVRIADHCGYAPRADFLAKTGAMLTTRNSRGTASMLRDIWRNARTEHDHILGDLLNRARRAGLQAPLLRVAYAQLQAYEQLRAQA